MALSSFPRTGDRSPGQQSVLGTKLPFLISPTEEPDLENHPFFCFYHCGRRAWHLHGTGGFNSGAPYLSLLGTTPAAKKGALGDGGHL